MPQRLHFAILATVFLLAGCEQQSRGFALPPGDATQGKATFVELGCPACHSVRGEVERFTEGADPAIEVILGGQTTRVKTYGDLVTSIINPSHKLSRGRNVATVD